MSYDQENPFTELYNSDPNTQLIYFLLEPSHVAPLGYCKLPTKNLYRKQALRILQKFGTYGEGDPVVSYLALTYFDNFIGYHPLPAKIAERRDSILIVVCCCFILASRKRNPEFCAYDFLKKQQLNYMEEIIDEIGPVVDMKLEHRKIMEPVTAVCFLDYLTGLLFMEENVRETIKSFAIHKLHAYHTDTRSTEFLPSIVAAVAIFSSVRTFYESAASRPIFKFLQCERIDRKNLLLALGVFFPNFTVPVPENLHKTADNENVTSGGNEINLEIAERSKILLNRLAAAKSRRRALIAAIVQCDLATAIRRLSPPDHSNGSTTETTKLRLLPLNYSHGSETGTAKVKVATPNRSHGSHMDIAKVKVPILVTAAEQHPDQKSGTSSDSSEHVREDNGSSANTALLQVPAPDRSLGSNLDTCNITIAMPLKIPHDHSLVSDTKTTTLMPSSTDHNQQTANLSSDFLKLVRKLLR